MAADLDQGIGHQSLIQQRLEAVKQQLKDLRNASEISAIFREVLDATDNTITITDPRLPDNPLIYVNKEFERLTGYSYDEVIGQNCRFLQGNDRDQHDLVRLRTAIKEGKNVRVELRNYRKNGQMFWNELYLTAVYNHDGQLIAFYGVQNDITRFKELADIERRRSMELTLAEYRERRRIAQRLHDGLQQDLYGLQFSLSNLKHSLGDLAIASDLDEILAQVQDTIQTTRNVTSSLDSPAIEEKDLKAALEWLSQKMKDRHGLSVDLKVPETVLYLNDNLRVLVVSLVRELLFNVVKHSGCNQAFVDMFLNEDGLGLKVKDGGKGFKLERLESSSGTGLGLSGIQERLKIFNGSLKVQSSVGNDTTIIIQIPV